MPLYKVWVDYRCIVIWWLIASCGGSHTKYRHASEGEEEESDGVPIVVTENLHLI